MFIDTHCHIDDEKFIDVNAVVNDFINAEVDFAINMGCDVRTTENGKRLSGTYEHVYFASGFHPSEVDWFTKEAENQIMVAYQKQDFVAVTELISQVENAHEETLEELVCLHFFYQGIANILYSMRHIYDDAIKDCLSICEKDIQLLSNINFGAGTSIATITRKAIILEKEKKYLEAIDLCKYAINNNYLDNKKPFTIRKAKLESKLSNEGQ